MTATPPLAARDEHRRNPPPAIAVERLVRRFGATTAVDELSFDVMPGETVGLLGHNGAGTTTTIRVVNGVLGRHDGRVSVFGLDPAVDGEAIRRRTGVLTETPSVDERLSGRENLEFHGRLYGLHDLDAVATFALGAMLWAVGLGVVWLGYRSFRRERLLGA